MLFNAPFPGSFHFWEVGDTPKLVIHFIRSGQEGIVNNSYVNSLTAAPLHRDMDPISGFNITAINFVHFIFVGVCYLSFSYLF